MIKVSRETIVIKRDKSVKKRQFVISAHFTCSNNISIKGIETQGPYEYWKVIEIDYAIFQDLESRGFSNWLWKSFGFCSGKF